MTPPPLWLPTGSVRSLLALGLVGAFVASVFLEIESTALAGLAGTAVAFYFEARRG